MSVCIYLCMYLCIYTHTYMCMRMYVHPHVCMRIEAAPLAPCLTRGSRPSLRRFCCHCSDADLGGFAPEWGFWAKLARCLAGLRTTGSFWWRHIWEAVSCRIDRVLVIIEHGGVGAWVGGSGSAMLISTLFDHAVLSSISVHDLIVHSSTVSTLVVVPTVLFLGGLHGLRIRRRQAWDDRGYAIPHALQKQGRSRSHGHGHGNFI